MNDENKITDVEKEQEKRSGLALFLVLGITLFTVVLFFYVAGRMLEGEDPRMGETAVKQRVVQEQKDNQSGEGGLGGLDGEADAKLPAEVELSTTEQTPIVGSANETDAGAVTKDAKQAGDRVERSTERKPSGRISIDTEVPAVDVERDENKSQEPIDVSVSMKKIMQSRIRLMQALED